MNARARSLLHSAPVAGPGWKDRTEILLSFRDLDFIRPLPPHETVSPRCSAPTAAGRRAAGRRGAAADRRGLPVRRIVCVRKPTRPRCRLWRASPLAARLAPLPQLPVAGGRRGGPAFAARDPEPLLLLRRAVAAAPDPRHPRDLAAQGRAPRGRRGLERFLSRHGDHPHLRRDAIRGQQRLHARLGAQPLLRSVCLDQLVHPARDPAYGTRRRMEAMAAYGGAASCCKDGLFAEGTGSASCSPCVCGNDAAQRTRGRYRSGRRVVRFPPPCASIPPGDVDESARPRVQPRCRQRPGPGRPARPLPPSIPSSLWSAPPGTGLRTSSILSSPAVFAATGRARNTVRRSIPARRAGRRAPSCSPYRLGTPTSRAGWASRTAPLLPYSGFLRHRGRGGSRPAIGDCFGVLLDLRRKAPGMRWNRATTRLGPNHMLLAAPSSVAHLGPGRPLRGALVRSL